MYHTHPPTPLHTQTDEHDTSWNSKWIKETFHDLFWFTSLWRCAGGDEKSAWKKTEGIWDRMITDKETFLKIVRPALVPLRAHVPSNKFLYTFLYYYYMYLFCGSSWKGTGYGRLYPIGLHILYVCVQAIPLREKAEHNTRAGLHQHDGECETGVATSGMVGGSCHW